MESAASFFDLTRSYNMAIWPIHVLTLVLGAAAALLALRNARNSDRIIAAILAFLWLWSGVVFLMLFLGSWTPTLFGRTVPGFGYVSGVLFVLQSAAFMHFGLIRPSLSFKLAPDRHGVIGTIMIVYAVVIYPIVGWATGHPYPNYPIFGTAACPVAIFTVGMLCWTNRRMPPAIAVIPMIWGLAAITAVVSLEVWADLGLFLAGMLSFAILRRNARLPAAEAGSPI
jgi:hypothetical protein